MSSHLKDPLAKEYIAMRAKEKKSADVIYKLAVLLMRLGVWPGTKHKGRLIPLSPPMNGFKKFYQDKRDAH